MLGHLQFFKLCVLHSLRIVFSTWSKAKAGCIWLGACIYSNWTSSACFCRPRHFSFSQNNGGSRPFRPLIERNWVVMPNDSFHHRSYAALWASEPLYPHRRSGMRLLGWEHLSTKQRGASIRSLRWRCERWCSRRFPQMSTALTGPFSANQPRAQWPSS